MTTIVKLLYLYSCQEEGEKNQMNSKHKNCKGFNKIDARILTSISKQYIMRNTITQKQMEVVEKRILKYNKQFNNIHLFDADAFILEEKSKCIPSKIQYAERCLFVDD
jgi:hypothetical protein